MLNEHGETSYEGDDTCSFEDTLIQSGECTDENGVTFTLTSDDVRQAYASLMKRENLSLPYYSKHRGEEVARLLKYKLVDDQDGVTKIRYKGVVHNPKSYYDHYSRGYIHTSPELTIHFDDETNKVIMIDVEGAAMSRNPGMNHDVVITKHMNFDKNEVSNTPDEPTFDWKVPLTNLESKVDTLIEKMTAKPADSGLETKMTPEPTIDTNKLSDLIRNVIKEEMASVEPVKEPTIETTPVEAPKLDVKPDVKLDEKDIEALPPEFLDKYTDLAAELEATKQRVKLFEEEKERQAKAAYTEVLQKCRDLGIEKPESFIANANLNTEQKTAMLQAFAAEFVKRTPINSTQTEPLSKMENSMDDIESVEQLMTKLKVKSDAFKKEAMKSGLFDESGKWIGDSLGYA